MHHLLLLLAVIFFVLLSGVCSGLNVALMSLDSGNLKRRAKLGEKPARRVLPLRRNYHLTLAAILLFNIGAVSATSLVLGDKFNGLLAGTISTLLIVIFGEIFPQALFARKALLFCYKFAPLLRLMIFVTYPLSKPLQLLLDKLFGPEHPRLQSRRELGLMITEHLGKQESELDEDEVEIVRGALQLSEKQVGSIMTPIEYTYWLTPDTSLTPIKIDEIKATGRSRIPVFNRHLTKCFGILLFKELVVYDFDDNSYRVDDMPLLKPTIVGSKTALDTMFRRFINSHSHLMPVTSGNNIVGVASIEDLLEEIIGHEIVDETDYIKRPEPKT